MDKSLTSVYRTKKTIIHYVPLLSNPINFFGHLTTGCNKSTAGMFLVELTSYIPNVTCEGCKLSPAYILQTLNETNV